MAAVLPKPPRRSGVLFLGRVLVDIVEHKVFPLPPLERPDCSPRAAENTPRHLGESEAVLDNGARCREHGLSGDVRDSAASPVVPRPVTATPFRAFPNSNCAVIEPPGYWLSRGRRYHHCTAFQTSWDSPFMKDQRGGALLFRENWSRRAWGLCHTHPAFFSHSTARYSSASLATDGLTQVVLERTAELETRYTHLMSRLENVPQLAEGSRHTMKRSELCVLLAMQGGLSPDELAEAGKEASRLEATVVAVKALKEHLQSLDSLRALAADAREEEDMRQLAREEAEQAEGEREGLLRAVLKCILPRDEADQRGCILEVRAGTGGDEASLFAMDLFNMYTRFSAQQGWRFEVLEIAESEMGGYKEASAAISGDGAFGQLKFESGVHRVQRVPATERGGRVHTSAASVAVLPQADEVDVEVRDQDLRIDTYRSGGAGGQSVNTTSSAVRVTHVPSGIVVAIQDERSQHQNKAKALKVLRARLFSAERARQAASRSELRQTQIGSGDRSERIRTYNFPQGRVTDHRVGLTLHDISGVLAGDSLGELVEALEAEQERLAVESLRARP